MIKQWFYDNYPDKGHIISADLDFGRSTLFVIIYPNAGFHALIIELCPDFDPDIDLLNTSAELGFMAVACKHEDQVIQTIRSYMEY